MVQELLCSFAQIVDYNYPKLETVLLQWVNFTQLFSDLPPGSTMSHLHHYFQKQGKNYSLIMQVKFIYQKRSAVKWLDVAL